MGNCLLAGGKAGAMGNRLHVVGEEVSEGGCAPSGGRGITGGCAPSGGRGITGGCTPSGGRENNWWLSTCQRFGQSITQILAP